MKGTSLRTIDLRSDTITRPTDAMRHAMATAEVGDDVFGEDPTVNRLEHEAARRMGKQAAVFMPSGTMVNQAAIWVHSARQGAILVEQGAHCFAYEGGAPALLSNVLVKTVRGNMGIITAADVHDAVPPPDYHYAQLKMVAIENTHNRAGGTVWTPAQIAEVADACADHDLRLHCDGARIFNSAVAQSLDPASLNDRVDSVAFCLSKGLSAPVGSVLCGNEEFIDSARRVRKVLGGGMRQAGVLAAAGLVALDEMVDRLADDHATARRICDGISDLPGIEIDTAAVQTNIVIFDVTGTGLGAAGFCRAMADEGVLCLPRDGGSLVRMVTHRHVTAADADEVVAATRRMIGRKVEAAGA